jgi:lysophospholipase L1-like esterase
MPAVTRLLAFGLLTWRACAAVAVEPVGFQIETVVPLKELHPKFCWFHPRAAAIPGHGKDGRPAVILTIQKHLIADDHYSGLWVMRTDDLGNTWSGPTEIPELAWRKEPGDAGVDLAVADVTPGWHARSNKLIALGIQVRYNAQGVALLDKPRSYDFAYTVFDPKTGTWTVWRNIDNVPEPEGKFYILAPGCVQWLVKEDGTLLVPVYMKGPQGDDYQSTVLHLSFDGDRLRYLAHGDELRIAGGRGYVEPSLARYRGQYYLTLRNDAKAYVAVSDDGLTYGPIRPWTFDDGQELGSYNTQAHWLVHSDGLFLCYTRRGADNDHIPRNRAPLFLAQVNPESLQVMRATEQVLLPERGVMLGNFGASNITPDESWVTDSEFMVNGQAHPRGADGSTWVAKVKWTKPNRLIPLSGPPVKIVALGDSITRAERAGVGPTETFAWMLGAELRSLGVNAETVNVGIGGERTDQALARLDQQVLALKPNVVTIMYGTNDSYVDIGAKAPRLTKEQYAANLRELVKRLRAAGIEPILMTPPRWGKEARNGANENPNVRLAEYAASCREVAKSEQAALVDHFAAWTEAESKGEDIAGWTTDQCHPNPRGQRILTDTLLPVVLAALKKAR